jgi:uncharacterized protein (DUF2147 family)
MIKTGRIGVAALVAALAFGPSMASAQTAIEGVWRSKQLSEVTIAPCGGSFCGKLTKVFSAAGHTVDQANENPELRTRKLQGLEILNMKATSRPTKFEGQVYNPEDGKTYSGNIEIKSAEKMVLNGCVMIFCKGEEWTRVK